MTIDIYPVWASADGTPDLIHVFYDDDLAEELLRHPELHDNYAYLTQDDLEELKEKYPSHGEVLDYWMKEMDRRGQGFIRVVINY